MYSIFGKPLKRAFHTCVGHGEVGVRQKKLSPAERQGVGDFQPTSTSPFSPHCPGLGVVGFSAPIPPKTMEPGETKAGNIFNTLKLGGYHVVSP